MIIDKLYEEALQSPVCVGLDFRHQLLPEYLLQSALSLEEKIFSYNRSIIEATKDITACYKLQIACYGSTGFRGIKSL